MEPTINTAPYLRELTPDELQQIRGGDGGKGVFWHIVKRAADCMIDDWERMKECFREGMAEAKN